MNSNTNPKTRVRGRRQTNPGRKSRKNSNRGVVLYDESRLSNVRDQVFTCSRTTSQNISLTPTTGWNAGGFDIEFDFSLSQVTLYIAGTVAANIVIPGSGDFTALFEEWRINSVECAFMYSANSFQAGPATGPTGPILIFAFDPNDTSVTSLSSIVQTNGSRIVQMANIRGESGYVSRFVPRIQAQTTTGATGRALLSPPGQWVSTDLPSAIHNGLKVFYDSAGSTYASVIGTVQCYFKINYSFQHTK